MVVRYALVIACLLAAGSALAESLDADAARRFVIGKLFEFNCFDGSRGSGRIFDDGSVIGTNQFQGSGPVHPAWLPAGALKVKGEIVCASIKGFPIDPCFDLTRIDHQRFRGSLSGLNAVYCNFTHRVSVAEPLKPRRRWMEVSQ